MKSTKPPTSKITRLATVAILLVATRPLLAQQAATPADGTTRTPRFAVAAEAGTTGYGPAITYTFSPKWTATIGYSWLDFEYEYTDDELGTEADLNVSLSNIQAKINWHPFAGNFHLSAGVASTKNELALSVTPGSTEDEDLDIGDNTYTTSQLGTFSYRREMSDGVVPYIGFGWTKAATKKGLRLYTEFGVLFTGSSTVELNATGSVRNDPVFLADVAKERAKQEADSLSVYPVVKLGLLYRF
jgi:hypothetical protein